MTNNSFLDILNQKFGEAAEIVPLSDYGKLLQAFNNVKKTWKSRKMVQRLIKYKQ